MPARSTKTRTPEAVAAHAKRLGDLKLANQKRQATVPDVGANPSRLARGQTGPKR